MFLVKKRKGLIIAGVVVLVLIAAGLCYSWIPRSWTGIAGDGQAKSLSGTLMAASFDQDVNLPEGPGDSPAAQAVMEALNGRTYRAHLNNLLSYTPFAPKQYSMDGPLVELHIGYGDGQPLLSLSVSSGGSVYLREVRGGGNMFRYQTDAGLYEELAALVRENAAQ